MIQLYILRLLDGRHYCGITNNLERRFNEHRNKLQSWASKVGVVEIVYTRSFDTRKQAARTERKIKVFGVSKYLKYVRINKKDKF